MGSVSPYRKKAYELLDHDPLVDETTALLFVGCSRKTWYNHKKRYLEDELPARLEAQEALKKRQHKRKVKKAKAEKYEVVAVIPKEQWQAFEEFVGYRGYKDSTGKIIIDHSYTISKEETKFPDGTIREMEVKNYKYPYYPGEAIPEPIDEDTGEEVGILWYQLEGFHIIETENAILILWPRGHGKTWLLAWYIEWNMKYSRYKAMYLSITDVGNDVADWVYDWADIQGYIASGSGITGAKGQRRQTPKSFSLKNGSKFKIFSVMDKKVRGKHGYTIFMDDIIEEGSETHPSKQRELRRRWNATLSKMRRNKLVIVNTRIYEGDFIEYLIKQFSNKYKIMSQRRPQNASRWKLYIDLRTPFMYAKEGDLQDEEGYLLTTDGFRVLIAPELYTLEFFEAEIIGDFESYMAEYMQKPTSIVGGMVEPDDIKYSSRPFFANNVQMCGIGVDLSWSESKTADMCGIVTCIMHGEVFNKQLYKRFTFIMADVERIPMFDEVDPYGKAIKGLFTIIQEHFDFLKVNYPTIPIIIAIERNSGGMIIIKVAQREKFDWIHRCIADKKVAVKWSRDGTTNVQLGITHKKTKIPRIFGELQNSIKKNDEHKGHETRFEWSLETSLFMAQLLAFPKGKFDDGPDAGGMIKDELNRRWAPSYTVKPRGLVRMERKLAKIAEKHREAGMPWLKDEKRARVKQRRSRNRL